MTTPARRDTDSPVADQASRPASAGGGRRPRPAAVASSADAPVPATDRERDASPAPPKPAALAEVEARCAQLEDENRRLKLLVADLSLRNEALKLVVAKKW